MRQQKKKEDRNIYAGFILFTIHISGQSGVVAAQQIDSFGALIPTVPQGQVVVVVVVGVRCSAERPAEQLLFVRFKNR